MPKREIIATTVIIGGGNVTLTKIGDKFEVDHMIEGKQAGVWFDLGRISAHRKYTALIADLLKRRK